MPSIQDVADQVNAKLDRINEHGEATVAAATSVRDQIAETNALLRAQLEQNEQLIALLAAVEQLLLARLDESPDSRNGVGDDRLPVVGSAKIGRASQ